MRSEQEQAETLAIQALGWMAGNDEVLGQFMAASGASIDDLRAALVRPSP